MSAIARTVSGPSAFGLPRPDPLGINRGEEQRPDLLPYLLKFVEEQRQDNQDTYIISTGREGWGKSSLGLTAALALDPSLSADDVILDLDDYYRVYDPTRSDAVYVFDEAARLFFNREWNKRENKALIQEVIANRMKRNVVFLHLPQMKLMDKYMREGRIDWWFACKRQGVAMVRKLKYNSYSEEAYYPIRIDDHRWTPLEVSHPAFAEAYYKRKDDAHEEEFFQRQRRARHKARQEEKKRAAKEAEREAIMAKVDDTD